MDSNFIAGFVLNQELTEWWIKNSMEWLLQLVIDDDVICTLKNDSYCTYMLRNILQSQLRHDAVHFLAIILIINLPFRLENWN